MPKKIEIVEIVSHALNGGDSVTDTQSRYHPSMIGEVVSEIYEQLIASNVDQSMKGRIDNFVLDNYTKTFSNVTVTFDPTRQEFFSPLPSGIMDLPYQRGVVMICPQHDQTQQFVPRSNNSSAIYADLEVTQSDFTPRYYVEQGQVYYKFYQNVPKSVMMKLCPTFAELDDMDDVEIPSILTKNGVLSLIDLVIQRFRVMPPEDLVNDNNSKQV